MQFQTVLNPLKRVQNIAEHFCQFTGGTTKNKYVRKLGMEDATQPKIGSKPKTNVKISLKKFVKNIEKVNAIQCE